MIIIQQRYIPTLAGVRRVIALARALSKNDKLRIIYLAASGNQRCKEDIPNVTFEYWGDSLNKRSQLLGMISSACKIMFDLPKENIYYYGMNPFVMFLLSFHDRNYLHEFTEYPGVVFGNGMAGRIKKGVHIRFMKKCQKVFVISKLLKAYCLEKGVPENRVGVLNMFVDSNRFKGIERHSDERYIAYCGNGENYKDGVDILIQSFAIVAKVHLDVKLKIVGRGPQNDWEKQQSLIKEYNLQDRVEMLGRITHDLIPSILVNSEILVLARPDNIQAAYGFPTKVGEYLSTGRPVVLTRVGELEDYLEDGKSCLFSKPDSPEEFAEKVIWLLEHPEEGREIGSNGKRVAENNFDCVKESKKVLEVINNIP